MNPYQGQVEKFTATFRTAAGTLTDPTTVTFRVLNPAGVETAYVYLTDEEVVRVSVGVYSLSLQLATVGDWWARVEGTGAVAAVSELLKPITVKASHFAAAAP